MGMTPGITPNGATPSGPQVSGQGEQAVKSLISWCQDMQENQMMNQIGTNVSQQELEVFLCGASFEYKKATLDLGKMQETGEGSILVRVNVPVDMQATYTVFVPKKLI